MTVGDWGGHLVLPKWRMQALHRGVGGGAYDNQLVIMLPDYRVLRVLARSVLLALALFALPWLSTFLDSSSADAYPQDLPFADASAKIEILQQPIGMVSTLFRDLMQQGLLKTDDKALYIGNSAGPNEFRSLKSQGLAPDEFEIVSDLDSYRQLAFPNDSFDFAFADGFNSVRFIERTLKINGVAAISLSLDLSPSFRLQPTFKIVYVRRFESPGSGSTVVAVRKIAGVTSGVTSKASTSPPQRICAASDDKKATLKGLETILLEPPQHSWVASKQYISRAKFLPDLSNESLDGYSRRVLVNVSSATHHRSSGGGGGDWFEQHYPTRNSDFDVYELAASTGGSGLLAAPGKLSEWLTENLKEDEFVVMKIEADGLEVALVEEMMKSKALCLIDELFLQCPHKAEGNQHSRPYWECIALYGMLREEGIAVHQWWD